MSKQVDFYLLSNQVSNAKFKLASRLANKLQRLNKRTLIVTENEASCDQLDEMLWSFNGTSFVAHERIDHTNHSVNHCFIHISVHQSVTDEALNSQYDVMINLADDVPLFNHQFDRIAEIVEQDEQQKQFGRSRYKDYKSQGFELKTHQIEL